jgi:sugar porter (SP) family MFS transporter
MYIAEITPAKWRGRMVSINQFAIVSGMLIVYFVNMFIAGLGDDAWDLARGWRYMFGSECLPALGLLLFASIIPESPRWLAKTGREKEASNILTQVGGAKNAEYEMAEIREALKHEEATLAELFKPGMLIVMMIGIVLAVMQQITGINVVLYFGPQIFESLGFGQDAALMQQVIVGAINLTFTIIAIWTVDKVGRKPLMLIGAAGMAICMFVQGSVALMRLKPAAWMLLPILVYIACFALSLGPVVWVYLSEIFPNKIRGRAMSIATVSLWAACWLVSQTFPMMDGNQYLTEKFNHGFPFFLYGFFCIVLVLFMWRVVPETKGKTLEEIEKSWQK